MPLNDDAALRQAIAKQIRLGRRKAMLNQSQLAAAMGVTFQTISKWEKGVINLTAIDLVKLAWLLQFSLDDMIANCGGQDERIATSAHAAPAGGSRSP